MTTILAMDPGDRTGFARWRNGTFESWAIDGGLRAAFKELVLECDRKIDTIVHEKFVILGSTTKKKLDGAYTSLYINGVIEAWAGEHGIRTKTYLSADKTFSPDTHLKAVGWYRTGKQIGMPDADDANDAARHLLKYMCDYRLLPQHLWDVLIDLELSA